MSIAIEAIRTSKKCERPTPRVRIFYPRLSAVMKEGPEEMIVEQLRERDKCWRKLVSAVCAI